MLKQHVQELPAIDVSPAALDAAAFDATVERFTGTLVAVHWRGPTQRYPFTGDEVHARLGARFGAPAYSAWTDDYALDRWDECAS